jgi:tRNA-2-methylthio-N6-dimethylallyladenosine synthase
LKEVNDLWDKGFKEITLLGQNVDSYLWYGGGLKKDFEKASEMQKATAVNFADLLALVAEAQPNMRIRFSTSNPQDMTLDVIEAMAKYDNICKYIHLPVQSGSDRILKKMNRLHTREEYMRLIDNIRSIIPDCGISQDMIAGFPTETEEDHQDTLSLMEYLNYYFGFIFAYSERPGTLAG